MFLYDWYPRKVRGTLRDARAVHRAVQRFFTFLADHEGIECAWASDVFAERELFEMRVDEFPGGFWWDEEVRDWQGELWDDLDARLMVPHPDLGDGESWGATMGITEHTLHSLLQRQWLAWRDDVIRAGTTTPEAVRAALLPRQYRWLRTPMSDVGGGTPLDAIRQERRERPPLESGP